MKRNQIILAFCLLSTATVSFARPKNASPTPGFYAHALTLNGQPINDNNFSLLSFGTLALVEANVPSKEAKSVPFRIYLRRAGVLQTNGLAQYDREYVNIAIQTILASARPGDELIIEPARKADNSSRHVIKLKTYEWIRSKRQQDGC